MTANIVSYMFVYTTECHKTVLHPESGIKKPLIDLISISYAEIITKKSTSKNKINYFLSFIYKVVIDSWPLRF